MLMLLLTTPFLSLLGPSLERDYRAMVGMAVTAALSLWPGLHRAFSFWPLALSGCPGMKQSRPADHAAPTGAAFHNAIDSAGPRVRSSTVLAEQEEAHTWIRTWA